MSRWVDHQEIRARAPTRKPAANRDREPPRFRVLTPGFTVVPGGAIGERDYLHTDTVGIRTDDAHVDTHLVR
ncbi:MAG TPA: hypothetical protein VE673_10035, partial [Pseudonocardiaceae bacterium]|nr:hypothetical protein [Pseudonocardiaceae bacterium]